METKAHEKKAVESEKCIIAVALFDNNTIPLIADQLRPEFFYDGQCGKLWKIILKLYSSEDAVDQVMVANVLMHNKLGGVADLARICTDFWTAPVTIESHVKTVREAWYRRSYINTLSEYLSKANDTTTVTSKLNDSFSQAMTDIGNALEVGNDLHIADGIDSTMAEWGDNRGPSTGLKMLDEITGGFIPGDYHIYAARASMGKTALMCNFIRSAALIEKIPSMGFSLEMSRQRMQTRLIGAEAKISPKRLFMKENIQPNEDMRIGKAKLRWMQSTFWLDDQSGISIEQIRYRTRRAIQEHGIKVIFVDYLQLCTVEGRTDTREQEVARVAEGLKPSGKTSTYVSLLSPNCRERRTGE